MVDNLRRGDQVLTQGGIIGKITKVKEGEEIEVELAKDVKFRYKIYNCKCFEQN